MPTPSALAAATLAPTPEPDCVRDPADTTPPLAGIVDLRPDGWTMLDNGFDVAGFKGIEWSVYGPTDDVIPPNEGPRRLALYETWPRNAAYFKSRISKSRNAGGEAVAVTVCGEQTQVWINQWTGELVIGWTDRGKTDVLVGNLADFTVQQLVDSAEHVFDCCG
jgi:hypothetical protein